MFCQAFYLETEKILEKPRNANTNKFPLIFVTAQASSQECQNAVLIKLRSGSIGAALLHSQNFVSALLRIYRQYH